MNRIELDHWYMKENELSISLMKFHAKIRILKNSQMIYYELNIKGEDNLLTFNFYSIEDAISFTEQIVAKSHDTKEVLEKYNLMFEKEQFKSPFLVEKDNNEESTIQLTPDEVDQALIEYFGDGKSYRVSIKDELKLDKDKLNIKFYLIEHLDYDGIERGLKTMLTTSDLHMALNEYINFYNYELIDFKYIGGIHRVGYFFDEDKPHYDGIELKVKTRDKEKVYIRK